jgi:hypothetical protein
MNKGIIVVIAVCVVVLAGVLGFYVIQGGWISLSIGQSTDDEDTSTVESDSTEPSVFPVQSDTPRYTADQVLAVAKGYAGSTRQQYSFTEKKMVDVEATWYIELSRGGLNRGKVWRIERRCGASFNRYYFHESDGSIR